MKKTTVKFKTIRVTREGRPALQSEIDAAVAGKPLPFESCPADERAWRVAMEPLQQWIDRNRSKGSIVKVTNALNSMTGGNPQFMRQQVNSYFTDDPSKRREPRFGLGLLLQRVAKELLGNERVRRDMP